MHEKLVIAKAEDIRGALKELLDALPSADPDLHDIDLGSFDEDDDWSSSPERVEAILDRLRTALMDFGGSLFKEREKRQLSLSDIIERFAQEEIFDHTLVSCAESIASLLKSSDYEIMVGNRSGFLVNVRSEAEVLNEEIEDGLESIENGDDELDA